MRLGVLPRVVLALGLAVAANLIAAMPAAASGPVPGPCQQGTLPHGALSLTCVPTSGWNGDVVVFARDNAFAEQRYRSAADVIAFPALGVSLPLSEIYRGTGLS